MLVEERLVKLERSAARWRWAAAGLALLLVMTACVGMGKTGPAQANVLSAQMFKVVNDQGVTVAAISSRDNGDGVFVDVYRRRLFSSYHAGDYGPSQQRWDIIKSMDRPSPNGENGRDVGGRFTKGNPGGPGNPFARRVSQLRSLIVENDDQKVGVVVDQLLGQQQTVIKSLGTMLKGMDGIAGGAIMPDGQVGLILDIGGLLNVAVTSSESR